MANLHTLTLVADDDDHRDINAAVAVYQRAFQDKDGIILGDGDGDLLARVLGEICRDWLEHHGLET